MQEKVIGDLSEDEQSGLLTGEDYILFNNLKNGVTIYINCDPEIQVTIDSLEFARLIPDLFPGVNSTALLRELNKGSYVYTDKYDFRPVRSKVDFEKLAITPSLDTAVQFIKANQQKKFTPFGFSF